MMKRKLILTGAALSLAVAMTGCGGKPVINQQPSSQEKNEVDTQAQTEATVPLPILPQRRVLPQLPRRR